MNPNIFKVPLLMILYYLGIHLFRYYIEINNSIINIFLLAFEYILPFSLFYLLFRKKIKQFKKIYLLCLLSLGLTVMGQFGIKVFLYHYIDPNHSKVIADRIASRLVENIKKHENELNLEIRVDKEKEYKKVYNSITKEYQTSGFIKSSLTDLLIYILITYFFIPFLKSKDYKK